MARITPPFYPLIYVRGYAATMAEIESTVATPYMGFNLGSTKLRRDSQGKPVRFIFESPLIRLIKDFGYQDCYVGGDFPVDEGCMDPKTVWVFRYYEAVSDDLGSGERLSVAQFAANLREFILRVRHAVCTDDESRAAFKVNLVAHSMGGLICRAYLQNICRHGIEHDRARQELLELTDNGGDPMVNKVFTYGTPHNGIDLIGINAPDIGSLDPLHVRNFNREVIADYLKLSPEARASGRVSSLDGAFDPNRFFCFIGTNHRDYEAFSGLSRRATGPGSDGLVMCENAWVDDGPRAYAYRSHSGPYGIVNSEEGYQNLRRFLFGQIHIDALLDVHNVTLPAPIQRQKDAGKKVRASYQIETAARVRGGNVFLHERRVAHEAPIVRTFDQLMGDKVPIYLFSGFLDRGAKTEASRGRALAFAITLAVKVPLYEVDNRFWFDDFFEGEDIFNDTFIFHLDLAAAKPSVRYGTTSKQGATEVGRGSLDVVQTDTGYEVAIPIGFPSNAASPPAGQLSATLRLVARSAE